jgi:putative salt-induced outer membrane protein YdiY
MTFVLAGMLFLCGLAVTAEVDEVTFRDGTILKGEIVSMTDGSITIKTAVGGEVKATWAEVAGVRSGTSLQFVLKDGTELRGAAVPDADGVLRIVSALLTEPVTVDTGSVTAINPPATKPVTYKGNVSVGVSLSDGNTRNRSASLLGDFEARSKRQRLTLGGSYNYAEDSESVTQRDSRGRLKYDFFPTERFYIFTNAFLEYDEFQDLNLRTALSAGPGYQFIDPGDFTSPYFSKLQLYGEAGLAYFNEDFQEAPDNSYAAGRWSIRADWPLTPLGLTAFHFHEGYPGLEDAKDLYITTEQGLRFLFWGNFASTLQVNWRWDNTPAAGKRRSDTLFLFTLGYSFEL